MACGHVSSAIFRFFLSLALLKPVVSFARELVHEEQLKCSEWCDRRGIAVSMLRDARASRKVEREICAQLSKENRLQRQSQYPFVPSLQAGLNLLDPFLCSSSIRCHEVVHAFACLHIKEGLFISPLGCSLNNQGRGHRDNLRQVNQPLAV